MQRIAYLLRLFIMIAAPLIPAKTESGVRPYEVLTPPSVALPPLPTRRRGRRQRPGALSATPVTRLSPEQPSSEVTGAWC